MSYTLWFILVGFGDLVVDPVVVSKPDGEHQLASVGECIYLDRTPQRGHGQMTCSGTVARLV